MDVTVSELPSQPVWVGVVVGVEVGVRVGVAVLVAVFVAVAVAVAVDVPVPVAVAVGVGVGVADLVGLSVGVAVGVAGQSRSATAHSLDCPPACPLPHCPIAVARIVSEWMPIVDLKLPSISRLGVVVSVNATRATIYHSPSFVLFSTSTSGLIPPGAL